MHAGLQHVGLVNIVADERLVPELIQEESTPQHMADAVARMLIDPVYYDQIRVGPRWSAKAARRCRRVSEGCRGRQGIACDMNKDLKIYKRLFTYLRPYKARIGWSVVFMGLTSVLISAQAYLVKPVLDKVILAKDMDLGLYLPPALVLVTILKGGAAYARDYMMGWVGQRIVNDIRDNSTRTSSHCPFPISPGRRPGSSSPASSMM